jgi:circadian clock protein KaiC
MAEPESQYVKTGIDGLDAVLAGGIPRGNIILLEGAVGTGKTTMGVEFIYRGVKEFGEAGVIVVFEVSPDKLARDAAGLGWDLPALERSQKLKIIYTTREIFREELQQADSLLIEEANRIGARRIFIDGAAAMLPPGSAQDPRELFHILVQGLQRESLTAVLALEAAVLQDAGQPSLHEESIADTVIRLGKDDVLRASARSIEIVKSRGHDFQMGRHSFRIVNGKGIEVYRRVQAPRSASRERAAAFDPTTRITTGVPGLDTLVNGGYFLGSTTVMAGISGVGKTVMGLQYVAEGARCGERSLLLSLDEQVPQLLRNATSIGIDLQKQIDSGILRMQYDTPQEIDIDRHFHRIESIVEEFKPKRVLIDSLSTYGVNLGTHGRLFRDFFHALVALMKEHQIAAVYNLENPEMLGMSSMMGVFHMSSLVDNIVLMNFIEIGDTFRRGLTVGKMRSNPVNHTTHECEVVNGEGMRVLPRQLPPVGLKTAFSSYQGLISRSPERRPPQPVAPARRERKA